MEATPVSEYQRLYDINFLGALRVTKVLGPDKILVVGLTAAVDEDPDRARAAAR